MSNVRTLRDIERTENRSALPSPWQKYPNGPSDDFTPMVQQAQDRRVGLTYINLNGEPKPVYLDEGGGRVCCLMCCPCFVDPCGDERRSECFSALKSFTIPISFIQIIMLIVALAIGGVVAYRDNPAIGPGGATFVLLGAKDGALIQQGQVWRLITPMFLHAGIFHLLFNLLAQLRFGMFLERKWGTIKYAAVYIISGIGASLMSCLLRPNSISVGASGALMGLLGAYLADCIATWHKTDPMQRKATLIQTIVWIAITMLLGISPFVDTAAHFGGALTGAILGFAIFSGEFETARVRGIMRLAGISATLIYFVLGCVLFWTVIKTTTTPTGAAPVDPAPVA